MNKKILIGVLILLILGLVSYYWWSFRKSTSPNTESAIADIQNTVNSINQNVAEGFFGTTTANPLENVPNVNPYKNTNPFSNIKTNPFK
jgi:hypothetical protein